MPPSSWRRQAQYSTILKIMQIMGEKGLVRRDQNQRAHVFRPARPREWVQRQLAGDMMERAFSGSAKALLVGALSARTKDELDELSRLIQKVPQGAEMSLLHRLDRHPARRRRRLDAAALPLAGRICRRARRREAGFPIATDPLRSRLSRTPVHPGRGGRHPVARSAGTLSGRSRPDSSVSALDRRRGGRRRQPRYPPPRTARPPTPAG